MKQLTVWFDLASPDTSAWFAQWPSAIEGHSVAIDWCAVLPTGQPDAARAEEWLRLLWASAPPGSTPSRWSCAQALQRWTSDAPSLGAVPLRDAAGPGVVADLQRVSAAAAALGIARFPAVSVDGRHFDGLAGLQGFKQALSESP